MSRTSALVEHAMRKEGFVSAAVVCAQYGVTRAQLLEVVLQGKIRPQKPDSSPVFYCNWKDCLAFFGTPQEYRAKPKKTVLPPEILEDEILLDGMIPLGDLEDIYRKEAAEKSAAKNATIKSTPPASQPQRVVVRPASFPDPAAKPAVPSDEE